MQAPSVSFAGDVLSSCGSHRLQIITKCLTINPLRLNRKIVCLLTKSPQQPNEKTLSHNAMSFLISSAFIFTHFFFKSICLQCIEDTVKLILVKLVTNKF